LARRTPSSASLLLVTASLLFLARRVEADEGTTNPVAADSIVRCPTVDGGVPMLAAIDGRRRLTFVSKVMDDQARRARTWSTAWVLAGLGLSAGNYTRAALVDSREDRVPALVGGTTALFIPAGILVRPLQVMADQRTLQADLATLPSSEGASGVCAALARAEVLFSRSAGDEAFQAGIFKHLFVIVGNGAIALFLGLGFDNWRGALINGGGGLLISEFQIYTQPTGAVTELARYRRGDLGPPPTSGQFPLRIAPFIAHGTAGLAAFGTF
jgi:hypothetical protein